MSVGERRYLRNYLALTDHGNRDLRVTATEIIESALRAADPYLRVRELISLNGDNFCVGDWIFDLSDYENIYLIGAGKATGRIAEALEDTLGDRISGGVIVLKDGADANLKRAQVYYGSHPIPDENGFRGAQAIMDLANSVSERDLVIAGFSGGSSALLPYPVNGVTLEEKRKVHQVLLWCGADITEINAVRKHLSAIKGGRLAKAILPATIVNITVSDVVGDPLDYITCPTVPDTSTFEDARRVLSRYGIWDQIPASAQAYLKTGGDLNETPKSFHNAPLYTILAVDSSAACLGAAKRAEQLGFNPVILTTMLKGEAKDCGLLFSAIAQEITRFDRPFRKPCAVIAGGENTVTIQGNYGLGGPNQVFALAASLDIAGMENIAIVSMDTDGTDGPTDYAGGMVDSTTVSLARSKNLDILSAIAAHDVTATLVELGDAIQTDQTGTNVNDLKFVLVA